MNKGNHNRRDRLRLEAEKLLELEHPEQAPRIGEFEWASSYGVGDWATQSNPDDEDMFLAEALEHLISQRSDRRTRGRKRPPVTDKGADPRLGALAELLAGEASLDRDVQEWRDTYLDGRLLDPSKIHDFFEDAQNRETPLYRVTVWASETPEYTGEGMKVVVRGHVMHEVAGGRLLGYADADGERYDTEVHGEAIAKLVRLAEDLKERYDWDEADATRFVLTGITPPRWAQHGMPSFRQWSSINMSIDPRTPPLKVASFYKELRKLSGVGHPRRVDQKTADLAVFASRHPDISWPAMCEAWNSQNPKDSYPAHRRFTQDVQSAWERVVGTKIPARPRSGTQTGPPPGSPLG